MVGFAADDAPKRDHAVIKAILSRSGIKSEPDPRRDFEAARHGDTMERGASAFENRHGSAHQIVGDIGVESGFDD
jgi:hypothetical protein